jgi:hypothetical protein
LIGRFPGGSRNNPSAYGLTQSSSIGSQENEELQSERQTIDENQLLPFAFVRHVTVEGIPGAVACGGPFRAPKTGVTAGVDSPMPMSYIRAPFSKGP